MAVFVPAAVALAVGGAQVINGISQKNKASSIAANNKRPLYKISDEAKDNLRLAGFYAGQGLPDATTNAYTQNSERGLSSTIDAILKGGGDVNSISTAYDVYNGGLNRLAMLDDSQRMANIKTLMEENRNMSNERDKEFQINQYAPFADRAAAATALGKQGEDNTWQGIGQIGSSISSFSSGMSRRNSIGSIFSKTGGTGTIGAGAGTAGGVAGTQGSSILGGLGTTLDPMTGNTKNEVDWSNLGPTHAKTVRDLLGSGSFNFYQQYPSN